MNSATKDLEERAKEQKTLLSITLLGSKGAEVEEILKYAVDIIAPVQKKKASTTCYSPILEEMKRHLTPSIFT